MIKPVKSNISLPNDISKLNLKVKGHQPIIDKDWNINDSHYRYTNQEMYSMITTKSLYLNLSLTAILLNFLLNYFLYLLTVIKYYSKYSNDARQIVKNV